MCIRDRSTVDSWFRNLWELVQYFSVDLVLQAEDLLQNVREGDRSLMSEFFRIGYRGHQLTALNIVRRCRNLLHVSDIVLCDGDTLDEFVISDSTEVSVSHVFPHEEPTNADFRLWKDAIASLFSGSTTLPYALVRISSHGYLYVVT